MEQKKIKHKNFKKKKTNEIEKIQNIEIKIKKKKIKWTIERKRDHYKATRKETKFNQQKQEYQQKKKSQEKIIYF